MIEKSVGNTAGKMPLIFSGTTEGRRMSERLSAAGIRHIVSVATGYGELVMQPSTYADVRQGRLTEPEMAELISQEADIVFDATHPYASAVSENIRRACAAARAEYVRVLRDESSIEDNGMVRVFADAEECAVALKDTTGNILLTTGSKELGVYAADPDVRGRLYVRVLPSIESIELCTDAGILGRQVIAMQGPFTREMDAAVIRQYDIRCLVTKSSGAAGGFEGKIAAAADAGIPVYVIGRPAEEEGISVSDALKTYFGLAPQIRVDLVATGPGRDGLMTAEAREAVRQADIICGAPRMIEPYRDGETYPYYLARDIIPVIEKRRPERLAILFSGDTGYCSGAEKMKTELVSWMEGEGYDRSITTHPGISSYAYLAARTGISYTGAEFRSLHGKSSNAADLADVLNTIRTSGKTFIIFSGDNDVRVLGEMLITGGLGGVSIILGRQLSYPDEEIRELAPEECMMIREKGLYTAIVINKDAIKEATRAGDLAGPESTADIDRTMIPAVSDTGRRVMPVLSDDELIRGRVPMTKENIRHLSILRLDLRDDSVVYDIGSGTGSVACEIAGLSDRITVYAIEKKEEACTLIEQNADHFGLDNIEIIRGTAPDALEDLPAPTHVFIGGSSGNLRDIICALKEVPGYSRPGGEYGTSSDRVSYDGGRSIRVVINAVSLETIAEVSSILQEIDAEDVLAEQISVSRSRELGNYHLMTAENPVMIFSFTLHCAAD